MKKLFCFLAVASTAFFTSCSSDDNNDGGGGSNETAIILTATPATAAVGETVSFTVKNNNGTDVTANSKVYNEDGEELSTKTFASTTPGTFKFTAKKGNLTSAVLEVVITSNAATAITITATPSSVVTGGIVTFKATTNTGVDVTSSTEFFIGDSEDAIEGNVYTTDAVGVFTVVGKYTQGEDVLTSPAITVTVTEDNGGSTPNNSFIFDGQTFATANHGFGFRGIYETATGSGQYMIVFDYNPYHVQGQSYPNDIYITLALPILPSGTNDQGQPTFSVAANLPTAGTYSTTATTLPAVIDALVIYGDTELDSQLISNVTVNIDNINIGSNFEGTITSTYTITLTDGRIINGHFEGATGVYDASGSAARPGSALTNDRSVNKNVRLSNSALTAR